MEMQTILFVCIIAVISAQPPPPWHTNPEHKKSTEECVAETNADISTLKPGEKPDISILEKKEMKCFIRCMALKGNMINANGEYNIDHLKNFIKDDSAIEEIKKCASSNSDLCEKFFEMQQCAMKFMPKPPHHQ